MSNESSALTSDFLASQKSVLLKLRDEIRSGLSALATDESEQALLNSEAREQEDDAQKLDGLERDGLLERRQATRLQDIERALAKIEDGSYGLSIVSGKKIPHDRLKAMPEALWNVDEEPGSK